MALADLEATIRAVLEGEPTVLLGYLFGSEARGEALPGSDVDVAVWTDGEPGLFEVGALAERIGRAVGGRRIDVVDLRRASPLLQYEVVREGRILICRDPSLELRFERSAFQRAEDARHFRAVQQALLREAAGDGRST